MITEDIGAALQTHFGHAAFRPYQQEIIEQVMAGVDTLGVLPTGAGKSLCYQLPAMLLPRPTLVISPLIALMQDQLDGLPPEVYGHATLINSSLDYAEVQERLAGIESGAYRLIYAAPERLRQQEFLSLLQRIGLSLVVVDEAHCVSVWGHDFRPDYLFIRKALEALQSTGTPPALLALTATATADMQAEIAEQLGRQLHSITAPIFRPNLQLEVFACANADDKMRRLVTLCRESSGSGIIYANSRDRCETLAALLQKQKISSAYYHAGLDRETRRSTQEGFMLGRTRIMIATVAFGMGVDKSNVRLVVHFTLPESLEAYTQEAGRAGRDGKPSRCVLLYAASDKSNLNRWTRQNQVTLPHVRDTYRALKARIGRGIGFVSPDELQAEVFSSPASDPNDATRIRVAISMLERCGLLHRHAESSRAFKIEIPPAKTNSRTDLDALLEARRGHEEHRLADILKYAEGMECRHVMMARHFDQALAPCGDACDRCLGTASHLGSSRPTAPSAGEVPDVGRVILKCFSSLPYPLGRTGLAKVLTGAADSPVSPDRCEHFGTLQGCTLKGVRDFLDTLVAQSLLTLDSEVEYPVLALSAAGREVLKGEESILPNPLRSHSAGRTPTRTCFTDKAPASPSDAPQDTDADDRFERLRAWRRLEAERQKIPPYIVFSDATLRAIAQADPSSLDTFAALPGIGPIKLKNYGLDVLTLLQAKPE